MPLDATALVTVDEVKGFLATEGAPVPGTERLEDLINSVSVEISRYTGRELVIPDVDGDGEAGPDQDLARVFAYRGRGRLSLTPWELRQAPTSVVLYTDLPSAQQLTLQNKTSQLAADYRLVPAGKTRDGTYQAIRLPWLSRLAAGYSFEVTITGRWGCSPTPAQAKTAAKLAVQHLLNSQPASQLVTEDGLVISNPQGGTFLPSNARNALRSLRRVA